MDHTTIPTPEENSAPAPSGCCGGKAEAQPLNQTEPRATQVTEDKPAKSGCCCSNN